MGARNAPHRSRMANRVNKIMCALFLCGTLAAAAPVTPDDVLPETASTEGVSAGCGVGTDVGCGDEDVWHPSLRSGPCDPLTASLNGRPNMEPAWGPTTEIIHQHGQGWTCHNPWTVAQFITDFGCPAKFYCPFSWGPL